MPTPRQKIAFREVLKGSTISNAMKLAKYSDKTATSTGKLTRTAGWKELTNSYLNDKDLAKKHNEQLNSSKLTKLYFDVDDDDEMIQEVCKKLGVELLYIKVNKDKTGKTANVKAPDFFYRDLALDKAYKVKGRYSNDSIDGGKTLIINITGETASRYNVSPTPITEISSSGQA